MKAPALVAALFVGVVGAGVLRTYMDRQAVESTPPSSTPPATLEVVPTPAVAVPLEQNTTAPAAIGGLEMWPVLAIGVILAIVVAFVVLLAWRTRVPDRGVLTSSAGPVVVSRWHCILEAHGPTGHVILRRGPLEYPAQTPRQVEEEVVARYTAIYGPPPPGTRYHCSAAPMATA